MKKKIIILLIAIAFCSGCGKSSEKLNSDSNIYDDKKQNIESDTSKSGVYHYSDSEITPDRELESGEVILKIGNKEFNILNLTVGKVLNNFNSSIGLSGKNIIDKENYSVDDLSFSEQYKEDNSDVKVYINFRNEDAYKDSNAKENFLHKIVHEIAISIDDTVLSSDFSTNISVRGVSMGMTKDEVHSILGEPSSFGIVGEVWYMDYRYKDTKEWLSEHFKLSVKYNDNNQVIKMYIAL